MSADAQPPPPPEGWQAQYLRVIVFPTEPVYPTSGDWWQQLTGSDPENNNDKRQRQEREVSGPFNGVELVLNTDAMRATWTAAVRVDPENPPEGIPNIGAFMDRREWFRDLMAPWLENCPVPLRRIAFAGSLILPTANGHRAAYEMLNRCLRTVTVDPESADFLYRVNRPRQSGVVAGLKVNRLTAWAALTAVTRRFVLAPVPQIAPNDEDASYACLLELDINTDAGNRDALQANQMRQLLAELIDMATSVLTHGDGTP